MNTRLYNLVKKVIKFLGEANVCSIDDGSCRYAWHDFRFSKYVTKRKFHVYNSIRWNKNGIFVDVGTNSLLINPDEYKDLPNPYEDPDYLMEWQGPVGVPVKDFMKSISDFPFSPDFPDFGCLNVYISQPVLKKYDDEGNPVFKKKDEGFKDFAFNVGSQEVWKDRKNNFFVNGYKINGFEVLKDISGSDYIAMIIFKFDKLEDKTFWLYAEDLEDLLRGFYDKDGFPLWETIEYPQNFSRRVKEMYHTAENYGYSFMKKIRYILDK